MQACTPQQESKHVMKKLNPHAIFDIHRIIHNLQPQLFAFTKQIALPKENCPFLADLIDRLN